MISRADSHVLASAPQAVKDLKEANDEGPKNSSEIPFKFKFESLKSWPHESTAGQDKTSALISGHSFS